MSCISINKYHTADISLIPSAKKYEQGNCLLCAKLTEAPRKKTIALRKVVAYFIDLENSVDNFLEI